MQIKVGDYITFKSATRSHYRKAKRKVNGFLLIGDVQLPTVGYHGWPDFAVWPHEILEVHPA